MDGKTGRKSNQFLEPGKTALVGPQELNPKPARKKAENQLNLHAGIPPKAQELLISTGGGEGGWGVGQRDE